MGWVPARVDAMVDWVACWVHWVQCDIWWGRIQKSEGLQVTSQMRAVWLPLVVVHAAACNG